MIRYLDAERLEGIRQARIESWFGTPARDHWRLLEVGSLEGYLSGHLPQAIHFPLERVLRGAEFVRAYFEHPGEPIVLYGRRGSEALVGRVAGALERMGFGDLWILEGGKEGWRDSGLPLQSGRVPADTGEYLPALVPRSAALEPDAVADALDVG